MTKYQLEHDGNWYITQDGKRVRIRTAGHDTGIDKTWVTENAAQKVLDRLNSGDIPKTIALPEGCDMTKYKVSINFEVTLPEGQTKKEIIRYLNSIADGDVVDNDAELASRLAQTYYLGGDYSEYVIEVNGFAKIMEA